MWVSWQYLIYFCDLVQPSVEVNGKKALYFFTNQICMKMDKFNIALHDLLKVLQIFFFDFYFIGSTLGLFE